MKQKGRGSQKPRPFLSSGFYRGPVIGNSAMWWNLQPPGAALSSIMRGGDHFLRRGHDEPAQFPRTCGGRAAMLRFVHLIACQEIRDL
jgi:hypothetical protein